MRKIIFIDGFLKDEVTRFAGDLALNLDGFQKVELPQTFQETVALFSKLQTTPQNYIFSGGPYSLFVSTLFGRSNKLTTEQLLVIEKNFSGFYFFVDASDAYLTQLYKGLNKKITKSDLAKLDLYRFLFAKSSMPLKLTYSLHEPNAKAKFLEEFKEAYSNWVIDTTDYKLLAAT